MIKNIFIFYSLRKTIYSEFNLDPSTPTQMKSRRTFTVASSHCHNTQRSLEDADVIMHTRLFMPLQTTCAWHHTNADGFGNKAASPCAGSSWTCQGRAIPHHRVSRREVKGKLSANIPVAQDAEVTHVQKHALVCTCKLHVWQLMLGATRN